MAPTIGNIVFYADDPDRLSKFWADVFGYPHITWDGPLKQAMLDAGLSEAQLTHRGLAEDPQHVGPRFFFHHADGPKKKAATECILMYKQSLAGALHATNLTPKRIGSSRLERRPCDW